MTESQKTPKLRITKEWKKSRIITLLRGHKGEMFSEKEILSPFPVYRIASPIIMAAITAAMVEISALMFLIESVTV